MKKLALTLFLTLAASQLFAALNPNNSTEIVAFLQNNRTWVLEQRTSRSQPETWRLKSIGRRINVSTYAGRKSSRSSSLIISTWSPTAATWKAR